ncbi:MAG: hypothetical protein HGA28_00605, partial [Anaerolineaceae bacterium]|nr:hypothetical protein [Anaerolineaceae bacterium]
LFSRDIARLCEYFTHQGLVVEGARIARELWKARGNRLKPDLDPALLDAEDPAAGQIWRRNLAED